MLAGIEKCREYFEGSVYMRYFLFFIVDEVQGYYDYAY